MAGTVSSTLPPLFIPTALATRLSSIKPLFANLPVFALIESASFWRF